MSGKLFGNFITYRPYRIHNESTLTTNTTYMNDEQEAEINEEENLLNIKYH